MELLSTASVRRVFEGTRRGTISLLIVELCVADAYGPQICYSSADRYRSATAQWIANPQATTVHHGKLDLRKREGRAQGRLHNVVLLDRVEDEPDGPPRPCANSRGWIVQPSPCHPHLDLSGHYSFR